MKRIICIFLIAFALCIPSCGAKVSPLAYQQGIDSAVFEIDFDKSSFTVELFPMQNRLRVISPDRIEGIELAIEDGEYRLISEDAEFELPDPLISLVSPIFRAFSLPDDKAKTSTSGDDVRVVRVSCDDGDYEIRLSPGGEPSEIAFKGTRDFTMKGIELRYGEEKETIGK
ncbi:MAG: hypothetical protein IJS45_02695 [Clostridia bacterium]|nr:hypothetical protein [Clostridia bacterium]